MPFHNMGTFAGRARALCAVSRRQGVVAAWSCCGANYRSGDVVDPRLVSARPRPRRRFRDADESRARILAAALAEFAAGGYRGASVAAIAQRAGMSQSGVLRHFPTKEALLTAVIERVGRPAGRVSGREG